MDTQAIYDKWKAFVVDMNKRGIPVPTVRDPKTQQGSVSFTMVCVSFGLMTLCGLVGILMVVSKLSGYFTSPDTSMATLKDAFMMAFQMSGLSAGLYWSRKFQRDDKGTISLDGKDGSSQ